MNRILTFGRRASGLMVHHSVTATSAVKAHRIFDLAIDRLLNVNEWDKLCGNTSPRFTLFDKDGRYVERTAAAGDSFKITLQQHGKEDCVFRIDSINHEKFKSVHKERFVMHISLDDSIRYDGHHEGSIVLKRDGFVVAAGMDEVPEIPLTSTERLVDKIIHAIDNVRAMVGIPTDLPWSNMVKGLLDTPVEAHDYFLK